MPPKADPYNTPVHRRIDLILFAVVFAIVAILLSTTAHAQTGNNPTGSTLITYFNFNDSNLQSDAPGARLALDSASTSSKFTPSFITPSNAGNVATGDSVPSGSAANFYLHLLQNGKVESHSRSRQARLDSPIWR